MQDGTVNLLDDEDVDTLGVYDDDGVEMTSLALQPCETPQVVLDRRNDLSKMVSVLKLGEELSIAQVAQRLLDYKLLDCKMRSAQTKVSKAVPIDWTPVQQFGRMCEIRRVPGENGEAHKIVLRLAEEE